MDIVGDAHDKHVFVRRGWVGKWRSSLIYLECCTRAQKCRVNLTGVFDVDMVKTNITVTTNIDSLPEFLNWHPRLFFSFR